MTTVHQLAASMNLREVLEWRLLWLAIDTEEFCRGLKQISWNPLTSDNPRGSVGQKSDFAHALETLAAIQGRYHRLVWETKTMLNCDYDNEVMPLLQSLPSHERLKEGVTTAKTALRLLVSRGFERETEIFFTAIDRADLSVLQSSKRL